MPGSFPYGKKTMWEKEKLLVTSNFSFSNGVFKRVLLHTRKNQDLFGKGLSHALWKSMFCASAISICPGQQVWSVWAYLGQNFLRLESSDWCVRDVVKLLLPCAWPKYSNKVALNWWNEITMNCTQAQVFVKKRYNNYHIGNGGCYNYRHLGLKKNKQFLIVIFSPINTFNGLVEIKNNCQQVK